MNRALRAATMGVLLLSPVALSACSSGQVTQTATQARDKSGAMAQVNGITLREVSLAYPVGGSYQAGGDAELRMAIVNTGTETDTLTAVAGKGFSSAEITAGSSATSTAGASGTGAAGATATAGATDTSGTGASGTIEIPAGGVVYVGENGMSVKLVGLDESLTTGQRVEITLTFEKAGDITVQVPVANPERVQDRGEAFDFHQSNGASSGGQNGAG